MLLGEFRMSGFVNLFNIPVYRCTLEKHHSEMEMEKTEF